jgi:oligopeptide transport system ATP-binding protein
MKIETKTPDSIDNESLVLVDNEEANVLGDDSYEDSLKNSSYYKINSRVKTKQELNDQHIILSVRNLKQFFFFGSGPGRSKLKAVNNVSFDVKEGECLGIVGESGCGKTTTGRSIIRLYDITSGSIYYKGVRISAGDRWNKKEIKYTNIRLKEAIKKYKNEATLKISKLDKQDPEYNEKVNAIKLDRDDKISVEKEKAEHIISIQKKKIKQIHYDNKHVNKKLMHEIQMIFQDPVDSLDPRMTVEDIIQEGLIIQGHKNKEENHKKVVEMLEKVGLVADHASRYPHEFSGGQRQRIGIARALVMNPKLLICDEPISALDVSIRAQIINLLNELKEELGLTLIFIAHDLSVVKYFCDRIAVMYFGKMVELTTSDELFKHPLHPYTKALLSAIPKPDPNYEKSRKRLIYNPAEAHDYSVDKPSLTEVIPGHFVYCNKAEALKYKQEIEDIDNSKK